MEKLDLGEISYASLTLLDIGQFQWGPHNAIRMFWWCPLVSFCKSEKDMLSILKLHWHCVVVFSVKKKQQNIKGGIIQIKIFNFTSRCSCRVIPYMALYSSRIFFRSTSDRLTNTLSSVSSHVPWPCGTESWSLNGQEAWKSPDCVAFTTAATVQLNPVFFQD